MKLLSLVTLFYLPFLAIGATDLSQIRCLVYTAASDLNGGDEIYKDPEFVNFYEPGEIISKSRNISDNETVTIFMKMVDKKTVVIEESEKRLATSERYWDLDTYNYVEAGSANYYLPNDAEISVKALCYLTEREDKVPYIKNFKVMIRKGLKSIRQIKLDQLVK